MPRSRERLSGVWAAMPTPWRDARRIDAGVVAELLRRYKAAGFDGAYTTGTDGEMHVLDLPEFRELVDAFSRGLPKPVCRRRWAAVGRTPKACSTALATPARKGLHAFRWRFPRG